MPPEQDPNLPHPLETGIESLIIQNEDIKSTLEESNLLLQSIALDSNNNDLERSLELQMLQSEENHKETLSALKELQPALSEAISNIPQPDTPDFSETNSLLSTMIEEIKKKEDIEIEIDEETRGRLRGEKGDRGERGEIGPIGKTGKSGRDGINGLDGKDGKNGKNGSPDTPEDIKKKLESLEGDERLDAKAIKGLDKLEKKVKGIERIQDNYVFGQTAPAPTVKVVVTTNTILKYDSGEYLVLIDTTDGDVTINLPSAVNNTAMFSFKRISAGTYTARILPNGIETIDTYPYLDILFKNTNMPLVSDGANWLIL